MKQLRTRRGVRLVEGDAVLSEVLQRPGATHSVFDVLAAAVVTLARGPRLAVLGFAGGGLVAPLRALGFDGEIDAVDLSRRGERVFRRLSSPWCGQVRFSEREASAWLRRTRRPFDAIIEDLSVHGIGGVLKPDVSIATLPPLIARRLGPGGLMVANLLATPGYSLREMVHRVREPFPNALVVTFERYENRIVLGGEQLPTARKVSRGLRGSLRAIGSRVAAEIRVARLPAGR